MLDKSDTSFSVDINSPSKSLKGVLLIFMKERSATKFTRDTEEFYNPKITKAEVTVEGVPNELYAQNMEYRHQYDEIVKHFAEGWLKEAGAIQKDLQLHNVNIASYYTDKYALWLDFRTIDDNRLHGSGRQLEKTFSYENEFLDKLIKEGKRKLARRFNLSYRYIDDLISFNNKRFKEFISDIYPKELTISETTESTSVASYLDLLFMRDRSNNITTKLYDKRDAFGFHIVNFPFMSSNIPSAPAYGVYASQLVRYARCCSNYSDFLIRHRALVKRLLSQGYKVNRLSNTFKKFYGRHTDLVGQYKKNVCQMFADSIS